MQDLIDKAISAIKDLDEYPRCGLDTRLECLQEIQVVLVEAIMGLEDEIEFDEWISDEQ